MNGINAKINFITCYEQLAKQKEEKDKAEKEKEEKQIEMLCRKHPKSALNEKHFRFKECQFFKIGNYKSNNDNENENKENKIPAQRISIDQQKRNKINSEQTQRRKNLKLLDKAIKKKIKRK